MRLCVRKFISILVMMVFVFFWRVIGWYVGVWRRLKLVVCFLRCRVIIGKWYWDGDFGCWSIFM